MERLTKIESVNSQTDNDGNITKTIYIKITKPDEVNKKLYEYENIEELCEKIVSQPVYEKYIDTGEIHKEYYIASDALYNFKERRIEIYEDGFITDFELDAYGKTWGFDKTELECGENGNQDY